MGDVRKALNGFHAFAYDLAQVERFVAEANVLWLAPSPAEPFKQMTEILAAAFPEYPPYRGAHPEPIPHLTVATDSDLDVLDRVEARDRAVPTWKKNGISIFMR